MELNEEYLLDELLALRREMNWEIAMATEMNEAICSGNGWSFDCSDSSSAAFSLPMEDLQLNNNNLNYLLSGQMGQYSLPGAGDSMSYSTLETTPSSFEAYNNGEFPITNMEEEELGILEDEIHNLEVQASCKAEPVQSPESIPIFNNTGGACDFSQKNVVSSSNKKLQGQPSKNLMAERRRRKRLNDRLSMLRSIVPKISKMDRTAILADAIEYVKELLEKINNLQREINEVGNNNNNNPNYYNTMETMGILRGGKPNEYLVRNSPKFNVERREGGDTRIEICCAAKPGLLLSTVHTLEALGLDIQQCVISCFNDFAIQASCFEEREHRRMVSTEEVKQALFENAGYGGRCL